MTTASVSVVAGIGPALGASLAAALLKRGHRVIGLSRSPATSSILGDENPDFHLLACDVTDANSVQSVFHRIAAEHGPVENLIYNAHELFIGSFMETEAETFERIWRVTRFVHSIAHRLLWLRCRWGMVQPSFLERQRLCAAAHASRLSLPRNLRSVAWRSRWHGNMGREAFVLPM